MRRNALAFTWLTSMTVLATLLAGWFGWLESARSLDIGMGAVALIGLWTVLWLPWDLYFAARELTFEQAQSELRGIAILEDDRAMARGLAPRLLWIALGVHIVGAAVVATITWASQGTMGYYFAAFYVLSMGLRPLGAGYKHLRRRLRELRERARYPRQDIVTLRHRLEQAEQSVAQLESTELPQLVAADQRLEEDISRRDDAARLREVRFESKLDQVLIEFERSMAKLTEDRELLQGIRAFVRVVRQS